LELSTVLSDALSDDVEVTLTAAAQKCTT